VKRCSRDRVVAAGAAIELAEAYEQLGERLVARKLATDASLPGDDTMKEAREFLAGHPEALTREATKERSGCGRSE
jgi:hypothetical protein